MWWPDIPRRSVYPVRFLLPEYLHTTIRLLLRRRWLVLRHHRRRLPRHVEQWRLLHAEYLRPTRHGFMLRSFYKRMLRGDAVELQHNQRHVDERRDMFARPVRCTAQHRFLLRRRWLVLRHHRRRLHRHVEQWRLLHARPVRRRWVNRRVLLLWRRTMPSVIIWRLHDFWRHVSGQRNDVRRCRVLNRGGWPTPALPLPITPNKADKLTLDAPRVSRY